MLKIVSALAPELTIALERDLLRRGDLHLTLATTIQELVAAAREGAQLCLIGPLLPDGDAHDAVDALAAIPSLQQLPVVLVASPEEREALGDVGFAGFIELPYVGGGFDDLLAPLLTAPRRAGLRRPISARVLDEDGEPFGRVVDLSLGGVQLRTRRPLKVGDERSFLLELSGQAAPLVARGRVVRARDERIALALVSPSDDLSTALREAIEPLTLAGRASFHPRPELGPRGASIGGALDAEAALAALRGLPGVGEPFHLVVRDLHPFDEAELDRWIALVGALDAPVELHGCPGWLGELAARMPAVLGERARVASLAIGLRCAGCGDAFDEEAQLGTERGAAAAAVESLARRPCAVCAGALTLERPVEATIAFFEG